MSGGFDEKSGGGMSMPGPMVRTYNYTEPVGPVVSLARGICFMYRHYRKLWPWETFAQQKSHKLTSVVLHRSQKILSLKKEDIFMSYVLPYSIND